MATEERSPPRRAYSYLRISSTKQVLGHGIQRQLESSRAYAREHGYVLDESDQLRDVGVSGWTGANLDPEAALGKFLEAVKTGRVEPGSVLIIESLDRLSRQSVRKSLSLFLSIIESGITVVTLSDNRTYEPEKTELIELMTSLIVLSRANEESSVKSQRVGAAWRNKKKNAAAKPLGKMAPSWLRLSKDGAKYEVIEKHAAVVRTIFSYAESGMGAHSIAQHLNKKRVPGIGRARDWRSTYVSKILNNRAVLGEFQPHRYIEGRRRVPDGEVVAGYYPEIIDPSTWYRVQEGLKQRRNPGGSRKGPGISNLFSRISKCLYCRSNMVFIHKRADSTFLICDRTRRGLGCVKATWKYSDFEASFCHFVAELDLATIMSDDKSRTRVLDDEIVALRGRLTEVKEQMDRAFELLSTGVATDFIAEKLRGIEQTKVALEAELKRKEAERAQLSSTSREFEDIKPLIARLQAHDGGDETYRLRSQLSSRLRSIVTNLFVAPAGHAPRTKRTIDWLSTQAGAEDVVAHLEKRLHDESEHGKYFGVQFTDGTMRMVVPDPHDPTKLDHALVSSFEEGLVRVTPEGEDQVFVSRPPE